MQIFNRTKILLLVIIFPEVAQHSLSFPGSENSPSTPGFSRFVATLSQLLPHVTWM